MRFLFAFLATMCISFTAIAEVKIDKNDVVPNKSPGYCAWASIETLARHHKIKRLVGLVEARSKESDVRIWRPEKNEWEPLPKVIVRDEYGRHHEIHRCGGWYWAVYRKLNAMNVKFYISKNTENRIKLIDWAMDNELGCVFIVRPGWDDGEPDEDESPHALVLIDYGDKEVKFIDTNNPKKVYTKNRSWFDRWSYDYILVIPKQ